MVTAAVSICSGTSRSSFPVIHHHHEFITCNNHRWQQQNCCCPTVVLCQNMNMNYLLLQLLLLLLKKLSKLVFFFFCFPFCCGSVVYRDHHHAIQQNIQGSKVSRTSLHNSSLIPDVTIFFVPLWIIPYHSQREVNYCWIIQDGS